MENYNFSPGEKLSLIRVVMSEKMNNIVIRDAIRDEWPGALAIHRRAIHELAAPYYSASVLAAWAPPIAEQDMPRYLGEFDQKLSSGFIVLVAYVNNTLAGFGEIVPLRNELLAVYVNPDFARQGVGTAILTELEHRAHSLKLPFLQMVASLAAVPFYLHHGYLSLGEDVHTLKSGEKMDCVRMKKTMT